MRRVLILRLFRRRRELEHEFCVRCAGIRDAGAGRAPAREQALLQAWPYGVGI